jgi:hypothetical protein
MIRKSLVGIIALLTLALIAVYFIGGTVISKVAVAGVDAFVPQVTGTDVRMGGLSVSPLTGSGEVHDFVLGNPEGYKSDHSISFTRAHLDVAPFTILGDRILIERIHVYQPSFNFERKLLTSNIKQILDNIKAASGRTVEEAENLPDEVKETGVRIEIKELIIEEAQVSFSMAGATVPVPMPRIVLRDIGTKDGGIPPDEMAFEVMSVVLRQVIEAAAKAPGGTIKEAAESIKNIFGGGEG